jgi:hypothetical protein
VSGLKQKDLAVTNDFYANQTTSVCVNWAVQARVPWTVGDKIVCYLGLVILLCLIVFRQQKSEILADT